MTDTPLEYEAELEARIRELEAENEKAISQLAEAVALAEKLRAEVAMLDKANEGLGDEVVRLRRGLRSVRSELGSDDALARIAQTVATYLGSKGSQNAS